ncbi:MAG: winged helix-turn-helix domain-containing protein [Nanoarchaeota archaeon]|nr:winged helix-turn-helix domain-containing protein [Nanoarchaeota archaeon]MBU1854100.1 winged helix-turn-helix domain-containing protein [Nanoarchaeota archaeon]
METKELLERLFDEKKLRIIQFFFNHQEEDFYMREVAKKTKIPVATTFRIINKLKELEIINEFKIKKFKVYRININKNTEFLQDIIAQKKSALNDFVEKTSLIDEIQTIILHGKEEKNKANILLIGHNIPVEKVKTFVVEIKESYDFTIIDLNLEPDQFSKMSEMGLFPGRRTVLFQK